MRDRLKIAALSFDWHLNPHYAEAKIRGPKHTHHQHTLGTNASEKRHQSFVRSSSGFTRRGVQNNRFVGSVAYLG